MPRHVNISCLRQSIPQADMSQWTDRGGTRSRKRVSLRGVPSQRSRCTRRAKIETKIKNCDYDRCFFLLSFGARWLRMFDNRSSWLLYITLCRQRQVPLFFSVLKRHLGCAAQVQPRQVVVWPVFFVFLLEHESLVLPGTRADESLRDLG